METYDLIVIGASRGGQALALHAARQGRRVVLFEQDPALPRQHTQRAMQALSALMHTVRAVDQLQVAGITAALETHFGNLMAYVRQQADIHPPLVTHDNLTLVSRRAWFHQPGVVTDGQLQYRASRLVIGVGSQETLPTSPAQVKGLADTPFLTPQSFFKLTQMPGRLAILGAGRRGTALAQALAKLGCEVHLLDRQARVLSRFPEPVSPVMERALQSDGVQLHLGKIVVGTSYRDGRFTVRCADDSEVIVNALLLTPGHRPATAGLDAGAGQINLDDQGHILVNAQLRTSAENVYAIGSCIDQPAGQSSSWDDHGRLLENEAGGSRRLGDRPRVLGVHHAPQVGQVGMQRDEAELAGYRVAQLHRPLAQAMLPGAAASHEGFMDLLIDQPSGKLLGATLMGPGALHVASLLAPLIARGLPWQALSQSPMIPGSWGESLAMLAREFEHSETE